MPNPQPRLRRKHVYVVQQSFSGEEERAMIPSNFIDLHEGYHTTAPIHMRTAIAVVRDRKLIHRWRTPTFTESRGTLSEMPMLATMEFEPWAAFSFPRRVGLSIPVPLSNGSVRSVKSSEWFTYFCFSREEDLILFRMVWS